MSYRFYRIAPSGVRSPAVDHDCLTDAAAMIQAGTMKMLEGSIEVWHGNRLVGEVGLFHSFSVMERNVPTSRLSK